MALVLDPKTGQLVDDGKPLTAQQLAMNGGAGLQVPGVASPQTSFTAQNTDLAALQARAGGLPSAAPTAFADTPSTRALTNIAMNGTPGFQVPIVQQPLVTPVAPTGNLAPVSPIDMSQQLTPATGPALGQGNNQIAGGVANTLGGGVNALGGTIAGVGGLALGALGSGVDAVRRGVTNLAGGDVNSLPGGPNALGDLGFGISNQGFAAAGQGVSDLGSGVAAGLRGVLGAQPTAPVAAPAVVTSPAVVAAASPAQQAVADSVPQTGLLTASDLAATNAGIAQTLAANRAANAPVVAARGDYNMDNTAGGISGRGPGSNGINFGFGTGADGQPQSATQYLAQMRMQDQQNATATTRRNLQDDINNTLGGISRQSSIGDIVAAKAKLRTLGAQQAQEVDNQGKLGVANITANATLAGHLAQITAARIGAAASLQGALQGADIRGRYGLQGAALKADAIREKAGIGLTGPDARVKAAQADLLEQRSSLASKLFASGQIDANQYAGMLKDGQVEAQKLAVDAITGGHISPERDSLLDQAAKLKAQQDLIAAQKKGK